jgi:outer membrane protein, heavy metal efflux system
VRRRVTVFCALTVMTLIDSARYAWAQEPSEKTADKTVQIEEIPKAVTLSEVLTSAKTHYPMVAAAVRDRLAAEGALTAARGGFDPQLRASGTWEATGAYPTLRAGAQVDQATPIWGASVFAGYRFGRGTFASYDGKLTTNEYGEVRGGVRVPVWRDGPTDRRRANIARDEAGAAVAQAGVALTQLDTVRAASLRYWDWCAATVRLDALRSWLSLAENRDGQLRIRVQAGEIPEIERQENLRSILQRQSAVAVAERDLVATGLELGLFHRDDKGQPVRDDQRSAPKSLPTIDVGLELQGAEMRALKQRPELARLFAQRQRATVEAEFARNQTKPAIDLTASVSKDLGRTGDFDPGSDKRSSPVFEASVMLDIPLLNRGALGRSQSADAEVEKVQEQTRLQKDRVLADVRTAIASLSTAKERSRLAEKEFVLAKALAEAELNRFSLGESTLLTVNIREQALAEAELRHIDGAFDVQRALANLRAAIGLY